MDNKNSNKQIRIGALLAYIAIALNIGLGLIYTPWLTRTLGQSQYGLYTLAISVIAMFTFDFGMSVATTRFVSKYANDNNNDKVGSALGIIYKLYIIIAAFIAIVLVCLYPFLGKIYTGLSPAELERFKIIYIILSCYSVISFPFTTLDGILAAYEQFIGLKLLGMIQKLSTVALVIAALLQGANLLGLVLAHVSAGLLAIVAKLFLINKKTPVHVKWSGWDKELLKDIFGFSIWLTVISLCQRMIFNLTPSVLGNVSNSAEIAVFGIASTLEGYSYTFASAISGLFIRRVTNILGKEDDNGSLQRLMIRVGRIQLIIVGMIMCGFVSIGREFIQQWMGSLYSGAYLCTVFLIIPAVLESPQQIADTAVNVANRVRYKAVAYIAMAAVNILLCMMLARYFGAVGAALSIGISYLIRTLIMNYQYKRQLNLDMRIFYSKTFLRFIPVAAVTLCSGAAVSRIGILSGWYSVILKGVLVGVIYSLCIFFIYINATERKELIGQAGKIIRRMKSPDYKEEESETHK